MKQPKSVKRWEKWIDKETCCDCPDDCHANIKSLIRTLLNHQRQEIIEAVEKMKRVYTYEELDLMACTAETPEYNQVLDDIINLIKQLKYYE